jgi:hypothetical protein
MKRRSDGGSQAPRRHKAARPKRRNSKKVRRKRGVSIAGQKTVVARLTRDAKHHHTTKLTRNEARRIAANIAKLLEFCAN